MKSLEIGIKTIASAGALALGIILVSTLTKTFIRNKSFNVNKNIFSNK